jgi:predicted ATPase/class 3 adenylate cyclase
MDERQKLENAIAELESQQGILSDDVIEASVASLREKIAALEVPEKQRKLVTILYADIVGSTNIVKHLDPEDALEIMDSALKRLALPIEEHGGHVARFTGDGFKAVFGAPIAQENDPEMGIRAGLGILEVSQEIGAALKTQWGFQDFRVRVGINTGFAALGGMTEAEDTVMGSTVNLAKRVEGAAPPGGILITHNTYRHVRGIFSVRHHEPIQATGFDEPVLVYRVLSVKPRAFRVQTRGVEGVETRMVGRKVEILSLQEAYNNTIQAEQTQVVTVVGEAGVGKSRLLYEFDNWIELLPYEVRFFEGRGRQETQNIPNALLKDVFTFRFQIQESDESGVVLDKIEAGFGEIFGVDDEGTMRAHIIGQLLGFDFSDSQYLKVLMDDPQQVHDRAVMYLVDYFHGMSEQAPVVIFLEDIHWADDSSLDILNRVARRIPKQRLLILCAARHRLFERRPYWGEGSEFHRILELQPLSKHDSNRLVTEILKKVDHIPRALQELIVEGAEGNPFYIEELIKMLIEDGVIITGIDHWKIDSQRFCEIEVPATLTEVLQARLEGLPLEERTTLQQASVVGHIFWDDTVEYINQESRSRNIQTTLNTACQNLTTLRSRELIHRREESAFTDSVEYIFKHTALRDVTYESVLKRIRRIYHGLISEWLIHHSAGRSSEYSGLIADHLELAGNQVQAAIYYYMAGERAAKQYANTEAVAYFTRALTLTAVEDLLARYRLLTAREKVLDTLGDRAAQQADLAAMKSIAEDLQDPGKQAQVALRQMNYYYFISEYQTVAELAQEAIHSAQLAGDVECEAGISLYWGMSLESNKDAINRYERALQLSRDHKLHRLEADSLRRLGFAYSDLGDLDRCKTFLELALEKSRQIGYKRAEAEALNALGIEYEQQGDIRYARMYFSQALQISRKTGNRVGEATFLGNLGWIERCVYDFEKAIDLTCQSLAIWREVGGRIGEQGRRANLGWLYFYTGEYEKAIENFMQAMEIAHQINYLNGVMGCRAILMERYSQLGDFEEANFYCECLMKDWHKIESLRDKSYLYLHICVYKNLVGDHQEAANYCREISEIMGDEDEKILELYRLITLGTALTSMRELEEAEIVFQQAIILGQVMHWTRHAIEAEAGLASIQMAQGEYKQALIQVDEILAYIDENTPPKVSTHPLDGTEEPFRILLTCYKVLKANKDPRANSILMDAYILLQQRAVNISDKHLRNCFLNNVAVNREIVAEYKALGLEQDASV